jgi:hypothetical protein
LALHGVAGKICFCVTARLRVELAVSRYPICLRGIRAVDVDIILLKIAGQATNAW